MIRDNGDMESKSDRSDCEGMPPLEDSDGDELALPVEEAELKSTPNRINLVTKQK